ncbi:PIG-L family deacetylase [Chitinophaga sp. MM2321]|uniref:PIG-L deacetylase family protein n=1 Tax=Chitinophaga sp. MM2321 TaxID=3137178 RepID=UPI0032D58AC0
MQDPSSPVTPPQHNKSVVIIVAHPDDETLWAGGTILSHPDWHCFVISLCRANDPDRAPRFFNALGTLGATGVIADLDDGPEQLPLSGMEVAALILQLLPDTPADLIITHNPSGEYTRHRRHEEVSEAVISLWYSGGITTDELWTFAYHDGQKKHLPIAATNAGIYLPLPEHIWQQKYNIITNIYGFDSSSWEARTTPITEAFWQFYTAKDAKAWLHQKGVL